MAGQPLIRPGGRSERIQRAVHAATKGLLQEVGRGEITIAQIAARAEVPPSTIYRRWSSLEALLAAVASESFHSDRDPPNTGTFRGDLETWVEHLVDDLSSAPGRELMKERIMNTEVAQRAAGYAYANLQVLTRQAEERGERVHDPDRLMDLIVAPILYRIGLVGQNITAAYRKELIDFVLNVAPSDRTAHQPSFKDYVIFF